MLEEREFVICKISLTFIRGLTKNDFMRTILILCCLLSVSAISAQRNPFKTITEKNGMIGIGTKSPDQKLTVKGKIHTQEVLVDLNGAVAPDYVFEAYFEGQSELKPEYRMESLETIEKYIEEHHHLPGIPSAAELAETGVSLKEMNLILLEKLEELTLYTIEQEKRIKALEDALPNKK